MKVEYKFDFENYADFKSFLRKHEDTINMMGGDGEDRLVHQIDRQVQNNGKLPEHFTFNTQQYLTMRKMNRTGIQNIEDDNRVTVNKISDNPDGGEDEQ